MMVPVQVVYGIRRMTKTIPAPTYDRTEPLAVIKRKTRYRHEQQRIRRKTATHFLGASLSTAAGLFLFLFFTAYIWISQGIRP